MHKGDGKTLNAIPTSITCPYLDCRHTWVIGIRVYTHAGYSAQSCEAVHCKACSRAVTLQLDSYERHVESDEANVGHH
jgi:hypothetical protein